MGRKSGRKSKSNNDRNKTNTSQPRQGLTPGGEKGKIPAT